MLRHARLCALVIGVFLVGSPVLAQSAPLDEALAAYDAGRLDDAVAGFERALAAPGNGPRELATIHLHLGILRASLGDLDGARSAFEVALALRPDTATPSELGPGQLPAFDRARGARAGQTLRIESTAFGHRAIDARVVGAPDGLVSAIVVTATIANGGARSSRIEGPAGTAQLPNGVRGVEVVAVDAHGGVVVSASVTLPTVAPSAARAARDAEPGPRALVGGRAARGHERDADGGGGFFSTAWPWIILGVIVTAAAVTTIIFATSTDEYVVGRPVGP